MSNHQRADFRSVGFQPTALATLLLVVLFTNLATGQTGDFNGDGLYDCTDIDSLQGEIVAGSNNVAFDLNGDGLVDFADQDAWLAEAGAINQQSGDAYLLGDANLDGFVDVTDRNTWNQHKFTFDSSYCNGDFNGDGQIDVSDRMIWNGNKFQSSGPAPTRGILDDMVEFSYDQLTGVLTMDTNGIGVNCFSVAGPSPFDMLQLDNGYVDDNGAYWLYDGFGGIMKWYSADNSNVTGVFELAQLATGLTADDFGEIGFMNNDWEMGSTSIVVTGLTANTVPEPNGMIGISAAFCLLMAIRRRRQS